MKAHQSSAAVVYLVASAFLFPAAVMAEKIVFPEVNDLPVFSEKDETLSVAKNDDSSQQKPADGRRQLSPCVWAIVSCCEPGRTVVRSRCFELLGCGGDFWDASPCSEMLAWAAVRAAAGFYQNKTA